MEEKLNYFALNIAFVIFIIFALLRPLSLMVYDVNIMGFRLLELVGAGISYFLLIPLFLAIREIKFNFLSLFILFFCLYIIVTIFYESNYKNAFQLIFPFFLYYLIQIFQIDTTKINVFLNLLLISFSITILISFYFIISGKSIEFIEWHNKLPRHSGAFMGSHTLAYVMLFYSYFYSIFNNTFSESRIRNNLYFVILIISFYCLYQSHTRTAILGCMVFWLLRFWGLQSKKYFYALISGLFLTFLIFTEKVFQLIFKKEVIDLNTATSGRYEMFYKNIGLFIDSSLPQQLVGRGFGHEQTFAFHNDYIAMLINGGFIGLFLYLIILVTLFKDILLTKDKKIKFLFLGIVFSVSIMNFASNAVIFRFEFAQYFWLIMGIFYRLIYDYTPKLTR